MLHNIHKYFLLILSLVLVSFSILTPTPIFAAEGPYRYLASTNECYSPRSRQYDQLKNYESFITPEECQAKIKKPDESSSNTQNENNNNNNNNSNSNNNPTEQIPSENETPKEPKNQTNFQFLLITNNSNTQPCNIVDSFNHSLDSISRCCNLIQNFNISSSNPCCNFPASHNSSNFVSCCNIPGNFNSANIPSCVI